MALLTKRLGKRPRAHRKGDDRSVLVLFNLLLLGEFHPDVQLEQPDQLDAVIGILFLAQNLGEQEFADTRLGLEKQHRLTAQRVARGQPPDSRLVLEDDLGRNGGGRG